MKGKKKSYCVGIVICTCNGYRVGGSGTFYEGSCGRCGSFVYH